MTAEVLDNVIHKIKTAYGISEESYVNHPGSPIHMASDRVVKTAQVCGAYPVP